MANGMTPHDGERFGRFTLLQRLGAGGMAEVYLARLSGEAGFEKHLVIKKILPSLASDPEFVERLIQEGKLVAGLNHGNIVQVQELGQEDGEFYLAMDYVAGTDLREFMGAVRRAEEAFPEHIAAHVLLQVARALAYAHAKVDGDGTPLGIVHRDISPANVLVSWEGEVKLTDFGIARVRQDGRVLTTAGMLRGKVPYMAPEQAEGGALGPESDVFSFGVLAYELLAGRRPYDGESDLQTLDRIRAGERSSLESLCPNLDPELVALVESCLARDRAERPASGEALEHALAAMMAARGWVVSNSEIAGLLDRRFPRNSPERCRAPATGVTASGTISGTTTGRRDRNPTKSLAVRAPRIGAGRWILLALILLLAVGAVSFGLGLVVDWHRGGAGDVADGGPSDGAAAKAGAVAETDVTGVADVLASATAPEVVDVAAEGSAEARLEVVEEATATDAATDSSVGGASAPTSSDTDTDTDTDTVTVTDTDTDTGTVTDTGTGTVTDTGTEDVATDVTVEPPRPKPSVTRIDVIPQEATIEIDGAAVGTGSHMLRLQPEGRAEVRLSHPGHRTEVFTLHYPAPRKVSKRLWAAPEGSLKVRYLPANASLTLDGKPISASGGLNIVVIKASAGPHTLHLVDPAGGEVSQEVEVREGEQLGITLRIE
ncbi:MAG: serine/threonine-protein kinase [Pseudomonadota bacterium]